MAATDPVESIRSEERKTPFTANLRRKLDELAHLEPSLEHPYITVYIDWRPEGENPRIRPGKKSIENEITKHRRALREAGKDTRDFDASVQRITDFINDGIDPAIHGIFILSCDAKDIFETVFLAIPLETRMTVSPTPALLRLVAVVEDYPRFAVLHADQHDASLYVVNRASPQSEVSLESNDYPRRQSQGGWSQRRYQARQDERVQHFARAVAEEVRRVLDEERLTMLILSVGEVFGSALDDEWHQSVKERIVGKVSLENAATEAEIIEAAHQLAEQTERAREVEAIKQFKDALGSGQGVAGAEEVLPALANGQVAMLLMADDFKGSGWADYSLGMFGVGPVPTEHPAGGNVDDLVAIDLPEEIVRLALATGASGEVVPSQNAARLHEHGGVGAILRYQT